MRSVAWRPRAMWRLAWSFPIALLALASAMPIQSQEVVALRDQIDGLIDAYRLGDATWGVMVVSLDRGDTLYAVSPDRAMAPASNLKLLTTAAALEELGPDFRFRSYLLTDGDVRDGVVEGDLTLYGTGDPGLSGRFYSSKEEVYHRLIDQLEERGIHTVRGDLIADGSFLPGPIRPEGWDKRDLNDHFTAPISALSFNENVVSFRIAAQASAGAAPSVHTIPDRAGLDVLNTAEIVPGRGRSRIWISRLEPTDPVLVEGFMTADARDVYRQLTVPDPTHFAGSIFRATLADRDIEIEGSLRIVSIPAESVVPRISAPANGRRGARILARHVSEPLESYLEVINKESHNLFAELVFRTLGRVVEGVGTPEASARAVRNALGALGVRLEDLVQVDGSGLSADNRVSASTFVDVMGAMASSEHWEAFWGSLPEAGRRRELGRMYRTAAAGNLRAKTGTIEGVSALTGLVRSADGERLVFSMLLNGTRSTTRAKSVENRIGARLASFERGAERAPPVQLAETDRPQNDRTSPSRHRVASGENLTVIARRYGLSVDALLGANPRVRPNRIMAGQWIDLPRAGIQGGS